VTRPSSPWQIVLARSQGALPFIPAATSEVLAMISLRRLWRVHVRDYSFETLALEHDPGLDADELMRSWHGEERQQFLSWISRRAPSPLARSARTALAAKGLAESFGNAFAPADIALERLDALLPASDPLAALEEWVLQLREEEAPFLEAGSELHEFAGRSFVRAAPRGAAWAASLAAAVRPQLFALGAAPLALPGLAPRRLFKADPEAPLGELLVAALADAATQAEGALMAAHGAVTQGDRLLAHLKASSHAPAAWRLVAGLGPMTRAEIGRALSVTRRTASIAAECLEEAGLVRLRGGDQALVPAASAPD